MERYASTFATTAACVGLLVAGHLAVVQNRPALPDIAAARTQYLARIAVAETALPVASPEAARAWTNPPAKTDAADAANAGPGRAAPAAQPTIVPEPAFVQPAQHAALRPEKARPSAEPAQRRRMAKARKMQVAARGPASDEAAPRPEGAAPATPERKIDPIGDILRGLGIGREG